MIKHLIHTSGDLVLTLSDDGRVQGWQVEADGTLAEVDPAVAVSERNAEVPCGAVYQAEVRRDHHEHEGTDFRAYP